MEFPLPLTELNAPIELTPLYSVTPTILRAEFA
jgi:hypothetical protein